MKRFLKKFNWYQSLRGRYAVVRGALSVQPSYMRRLALVADFFSDIRAYRAMRQRAAFSWNDISPRLYEKTKTHEEDPTYFYPDSWCIGKVFAAQPAAHVDIGSKLEMLGALAQLVPTTFVDIRIADVELPNLSCVAGDITALPFPDNAIASLSSICVIEHIGLGRYGDALDPRGTEKAAAQLARVLAPGGDLYISVPVDAADRTHFNANRAFSRASVLALFQSLALVEEKYIYGRRVAPSYDPKQPAGTGLYHFRKL